MGNGTSKGYHQAPLMFMKKRKHSISVLDSMNTFANNDKKKVAGQQLTEANVATFLLENPTFLDDFVKDNVDLRRLKLWQDAKEKGSAAYEQHSIEGFPVEDSTKLHQLMTLRSHFYFPLEGDPEDVETLMKISFPLYGKLPPDIENHLFPFMDIQHEDINIILLYLFESLFGRHAFVRYNLAHFLAGLKKNYMDVEYHNYHHAMCHAQTMYWILRSCPDGFSETEKKALLIASVCHDFGHVGFTEDYVLKLFKGSWFKSPVLENHHVQSTCSFLMVDKNNILCNSSVEEFDEVILEIRKCIIATFINLYPEQMKKWSDLNEKGFSFDDKECRDAAKCMLMMICDLSASWKTWEVHASCTYNLYMEFHKQGDALKKLGYRTMDSMLSENVEKIPHYQIGFLEKLALPMFEKAAKVFPCLNAAVVSTKENIRRWIDELN